MAMERENKTFRIKHEIDCFSDCCRVCMCKDTNMKSVFSTDFSRAVEELQFSTGILITQDDGLPTMLCKECLKMLSVAYKFKTTCIQSDEMFRKMLKQRNMPQNTIKAEIKESDDENIDDDNEIDVDDDNHHVVKQEVQIECEESFDSSDEIDECEMQSPPMSDEKATSKLILKKSAEKYLNAYECFIKWKNGVNATSFSENVFLDYFNELVVRHKYKPSTMWAKYSMLRTTIKTKNGVDIKHYLKLNAFLRNQAKGFKSKKSLALSTSDIERFIKEAPDERYLATKVALIFGVTGACTCTELKAITTKDIERHGEALVIKIPSRKRKNQISSSFIVHGEFYKIVEKYESQRVPNLQSDRFFQNYQKGKCTAQFIGSNKFGTMPKVIAKFLKLPNANAFTGHSIRRAAMFQTDSEAHITLQRHGELTSNKAPERVIENHSGSMCKTDPDGSIGNREETKDILRTKLRSKLKLK